MQPGTPDRYRWVPWVIVPLVFIIYASLPTRKYYFDGVVFAAIIEHGPWQDLFNPHHLLYTWIFYLIENAFESVLGRDVQALYVMQWANIILGTLGVGLIWKLVARLVEDRGLALLMTLLGCFGFTYWHYATDADVYIISTIFLILAADRLEWIIRHREPRTGDFVVIGLFQALSILFHQLNIFWIVCVAGCLALRAVSGSRNERWKWWWVYLAGMAVPVGGLYLGIGIFALGHNTLSSFSYWITEYGHEERYWILNLRDIMRWTLNGYLMVFIHRYSIKAGILEYDLMLAIEQGRIWQGIVKKVFGYYSLGFLFFCYVAALYNLRKYAIQFPRRAVFAFTWMAPYVLFQFVFMPLNFFYKLFIFVPLLSVLAWYALVEIPGERKWLKWLFFAAFVVVAATQELLLATMLAVFIVAFEVFHKRKNSLYRWGLFIMVAFLGLYNYIAGILPESRLENNPEVVCALELQDSFREGDILMFEGGYDYPDGWIIAALTPARTMNVDELNALTETERDELFASVLERGGRVFIHPNITELTEQLEASAEKFGFTPDEYLEVLRSYEWEEGFELDGREFMQLGLERE